MGTEKGPLFGRLRGWDPSTWIKGGGCALISPPVAQ